MREAAVTRQCIHYMAELSHTKLGWKKRSKQEERSQKTVCSREGTTCSMQEEQSETKKQSRHVTAVDGRRIVLVSVRCPDATWYLLYARHVRKWVAWLAARTVVTLLRSNKAPCHKGDGCASVRMNERRHFGAMEEQALAKVKDGRRRRRDSRKIEQGRNHQTQTTETRKRLALPYRETSI